MQQKKFVVGLTGGAGSGKSTVANMFQKHNIDIIDADLIAHELLSINKPVANEIVSYFGISILNTNGLIDRKSLQTMIFQDKTKRQWLESLLHPKIIQEIKKLIKKTTSIYTIVVIPLLAETNYKIDLDKICVIDCTTNTQLQRLTQQRQIPKSIAEAILQSQATRKQRIAIADEIILNDGQNKQILEKKVENLHNTYFNLLCNDKMK